jgi:hypothetical protein
VQKLQKRGIIIPIKGLAPDFSLLLDDMGVAGMSDEESDYAGSNTNPILYLSKPWWRSPALGTFLRDLDNPSNYHTQLQRHDSGKVNIDAKVPLGLPIDCYSNMSLLSCAGHKLQTHSKPAIGFERITSDNLSVGFNGVPSVV